MTLTRDEKKRIHQVEQERDRARTKIYENDLKKEKKRQEAINDVVKWGRGRAALIAFFSPIIALSILFFGISLIFTDLKNALSIMVIGALLGVLAGIIGAIKRIIIMY